MTKILKLADYQVVKLSGVDVVIDAFFRKGFSAVSRSDLPAVTMTPPINWCADPLNDRNWMFQLHGWRMLDAFFNRMRPEDVSFIGAVVKDWWQCYQSNPTGSSWFWYDMSTGLRASKLAFLLAWCADRNVSLPISLDVFECLVKEHLDHLTSLPELNGGNHGLFQLNGLMALVDSLERTRWRPHVLRDAKGFAVTHMLRILRSQLGEDGVHTEDSPDYHFFALSKIRQVLSAPWWQQPEMASARAMLEQAEIAQYWLVTPSLICPPVGDSAEVPKLKDMARLREWPHQEQSNSLAARLDGYAIVRSAPEASTDKSHYLFFQGSFHTSGHKHADCLSFIWQEAGQYLLWDSGKYGYQKNDWRAYFQSTRAHNCLEVDAQDYSRNKRDAYGSAIQCLEPVGGGWLIVGSVEHTRLKVSHTRILFYQPSVGVDVLDLVKSHKPGMRQYRLWWQLGPNANVTVDNGEVLATQSNGSRLRGRFGGNIDSRPELKELYGETQPRLAGWVSQEYLKYTPATSLSVGWATDTGELSLVSSWRLDEASNTPPAFVVDGTAIVVNNPDLARSIQSVCAPLGWHLNCRVE